MSVSDLSDLIGSVEKGQAPKAAELVKSLLAAGTSPEAVLNEGLIAVMSRVGERFQAKEVYVPEVLLAARAMLAGMEALEPALVEAGVERQGKVVLGTVKGDIHNIGKNLVGIMLKGAGFEVNDLGVDVPPQRFVEAAQAGAQLVCMSALLTTSMPMMKTTLQALRQAGLKVKTMVGGAVVTQSHADSIGADGYAPDAASAAIKARELLAGRHKMKHYTARDRVVAALRRQYTDRVPVTVLFGPNSAALAGFSIKEFITDAGKAAASLLKFYETFQPDTVGVGSLDTLLLSEAVGNELDYPEDSVSHIRKHALEDKGNLARLKAPDPKSSGRLPLYLEVCHRLNSALKDSMPVSGAIAGPWNLAMQLRGVEALIYDTMDDPHFVHELMRFTTEVCKAWGVAVRETGVGLSLGEASASCSVISPDIYRQFIQPYQKELVSFFKDRKVFMAAHICGYIDPIMEDLIASGVSSLSIDSQSSLKRLVELSQGRVAIIGNVDTGLFIHGSPAEMEAGVKECLETAAAGSGYILCSGCQIPIDSDPGRIAHYFKVGRQYGAEFTARLRESKPHLFQ